MKYGAILAILGIGVYLWKEGWFKKLPTFSGWPSLPSGMGAKKWVMLYGAGLALGVAMALSGYFPKAFALSNAPYLILGYGFLLFVLGLVLNPDEAKSVSRTMLFVAFGIYGFSHTPWFGPCDEVCKAKREEDRVRYHQEEVARVKALEEARIAAARQVRVTKECSGGPHYLELGPDWTTIPGGGKCRFIHNLGSKVVLFKDRRGEFRSDGWQVRNPGEIRAVRDKIAFYYSLCPLTSGTEPVNWDCTPL